MSTTAAQRLFDSDARERLTQAIKATELKTSGEVCVFVEDHDGGDSADSTWARGKALFAELGLTKTAARNGVLFYLAVADHRFVVMGDRGIDEKVPPGFWNGIRDQLHADFAAGRFVEGLERAVGTAGDQLARYFPRSEDDVNELSDDIHVR